MTIREQIEAVLKPLPPSEQLRELEKLAMKIRKANSIRINNEAMFSTLKYQRVKS